MKLTKCFILILSLISTVSQAAYVGDLTITGIQDRQIYTLSGSPLTSSERVYSGLQTGTLTIGGETNSFKGFCLTVEKETNFNTPYQVTSMMSLSDYLKLRPELLEQNPNVETQLASLLISQISTVNTSSAVLQGAIWKILNPSLNIYGGDSGNITSLLENLKSSGNNKILSDYTVINTNGAQDYLMNTPHHSVPTPKSLWLVIIGGVVMVLF